MIFVVLGTWEMPFTRPLKEIDRACGHGIIKEPVVVQCGRTVYESEHMELVPFYDKAELEQMYERASFVISQAGVGSIMLGLKKAKKVIGIARLAKYNEHIDDHQLEILDVFSKSASVLAWKGTGDLEDVLARAANFVPTAYSFGKEKISGEILQYLRSSLS